MTIKDIQCFGVWFQLSKLNMKLIWEAILIMEVAHLNNDLTTAVMSLRSLVVQAIVDTVICLM